MPKITLLNTGSGKTENFEPIDAREILASPDSIYKVPKDAAETIGKQYDPGTTSGINVPQLQGGDAELQTGLSIEKYGREAVVKAQPGDPHSGSNAVLTTSGRLVEGTDPRETASHGKKSTKKADGADAS